MYEPRKAAFFVAFMAGETKLPYPECNMQCYVDILEMSDNELTSEIERANRDNRHGIVISVTPDFLIGLRKDIARFIKRKNEGIANGL